MDFTYRSPPDENRIAFAILFAMLMSEVLRFTL